jgi:glycosyltransferase involved in cell wall biosynthesis
LIKSFVKLGHEVIAMAEFTDDETRTRIELLGASFISYSVQRNSMNPARDLITFLSLRSTFSKIKPDIIFSYTIKPIIWGGLALRSTGMSSKFYALITGLGLAFQPGGTKQKILTCLVTRLYRWALIPAEKVIFQNHDNRQVFIACQIMDARRSVVVNGSGVNLDHYVASPLPQGPIVFLAIARLLGDKGLREYAKAAQDVRGRHPETIFQLVGPVDPSPDGVPLSEVQGWHDSGALQYLGSVTDVRPFIEKCHVYVLPSYHEGMPRTVLEAMAMARPIITTDAPGCRETVVDGDNGFLVPVKSPQALALAMCKFIEHPEIIEKMGLRSRKLAENKFDVQKVNDQMLQIMGLQ